MPKRASKASSKESSEARVDAELPPHLQTRSSRQRISQSGGGAAAANDTASAENHNNNANNKNNAAVATKNDDDDDKDDAPQREIKSTRKSTALTADNLRRLAT